MSWQPIETAPRDGTWILAWVQDPIFPGVEVVKWGDDDIDEAPCWLDRGECEVLYSITHWMPIPEPPK